MKNENNTGRYGAFVLYAIYSVQCVRRPQTLAPSDRLAEVPNCILRYYFFKLSSDYCSFSSKLAPPAPETSSSSSSSSLTQSSIISYEFDVLFLFFVLSSHLSLAINNNNNNNRAMARDIELRKTLTIRKFAVVFLWLV